MNWRPASLLRAPCSTLLYRLQRMGCKRRVLKLLLGVHFAAAIALYVHSTRPNCEGTGRALAAPSPTVAAVAALPTCSTPNSTKGHLEFSLDAELENWNLSSVEANNREVRPGGWWSPSACRPKEKVLIVVPYRNRERHLTVLLGHLHPLLRQQLISYRLFVVEQQGNDTFNKGRLLNAAFLEASKQEHFDCVIFHDVDLMPEDDRIPYSCPEQPRHLSVAVNTFGYALPYPWLIGGVFAIRKEHFVRTNGYPLGYWGWGGEDDNLAIRLKVVQLEITHPPAEIARYQMAGHKKATWNLESIILLQVAAHLYQSDGLNSDGFYAVASAHNAPLYTHLMVDVGLRPTTQPSS